MVPAGRLKGEEKWQDAMLPPYNCGLQATARKVDSNILGFSGLVLGDDQLPRQSRPAKWAVGPLNGRLGLTAGVHGLRDTYHRGCR